MQFPMLPDTSRYSGQAGTGSAVAGLLLQRHTFSTIFWISLQHETYTIPSRHHKRTDPQIFWVTCHGMPIWIQNRRSKKRGRYRFADQKRWRNNLYHRKKIHFLAELKTKFGDQHIDTVFDNKSTRLKKNFYQSVMKNHTVLWTKNKSDSNGTMGIKR